MASRYSQVVRRMSLARGRARSHAAGARPAGAERSSRRERRVDVGTDRGTVPERHRRLVRSCGRPHLRHERRQRGRPERRPERHLHLGKRRQHFLGAGHLVSKHRHDPDRLPHGRLARVERQNRSRAVLPQQGLTDLERIRGDLRGGRRRDRQRIGPDRRGHGRRLRRPHREQHRAADRAARGAPHEQSTDPPEHAGLVRLWRRARDRRHGRRRVSGDRVRGHGVRHVQRNDLPQVARIVRRRGLELRHGAVDVCTPGRRSRLAAARRQHGLQRARLRHLESLRPSGWVQRRRRLRRGRESRSRPRRERRLVDPRRCDGCDEARARAASRHGVRRAARRRRFRRRREAGDRYRKGDRLFRGEAGLRESEPERVVAKPDPRSFVEHDRIDRLRLRRNRTRFRAVCGRVLRLGLRRGHRRGAFRRVAHFVHGHRGARRRGRRRRWARRYRRGLERSRPQRQRVALSEFERHAGSGERCHMAAVGDARPVLPGDLGVCLRGDRVGRGAGHVERAHLSREQHQRWNRNRLSGPLLRRHPSARDAELVRAVAERLSEERPEPLPGSRGQRAGLLLVPIQVRLLRLGARSVQRPQGRRRRRERSHHRGGRGSRRGRAVRPRRRLPLRVRPVRLRAERVRRPFGRGRERLRRLRRGRSEQSQD